MGEVNKAKTHKVVMDNRNSLSMTGISKVTSIDPDLVLLFPVHCLYALRPGL